MKNLIIIFFIFIFLLACKREKIWFNDTTVEGTLLDSTNLEAIKDVEVILYRWKKKATLFGDTYDRVDIKARKTDENGSFKIKFNRVEERNYYIRFDISYFDYDLYINNKLFEDNVDSLIKNGPLIYRVKK